MSLYQEVRSACQELGFRPRKGLGQNFLIHENVIKVILRLINLSEGDEIVEIGPGFGSLTRRLVAVASRVWAIEVDTMLVEWLRRTPLGCDPTLDLVHGDVLKIRFEDILPGHKVKLVANLPYNISTPVLFRLFEERDRFSLLVLMVQREVAERMAASPGTKSYGTLSIWCQIHGHILTKVSVSPEAFFPRPSVRSTVLKIGLHPKPLIAHDNLPALRALVRGAFGQRRKTLSNTFRGLLKRGRGEIEEFLLHEGIDPKRRGETLTIEEFIRLAVALKAQFEDQ